MKKSFDNLAKLSTYVDPNFSGRDWNLATAMVIKGEGWCRSWATGPRASSSSRQQEAGQGLPLLSASRAPRAR